MEQMSITRNYICQIREN